MELLRANYHRYANKDLFKTAAVMDEKFVLDQDCELHIYGRKMGAGRVDVELYFGKDCPDPYVVWSITAVDDGNRTPLPIFVQGGEGNYIRVVSDGAHGRLGVSIKYRAVPVRR